MAWAVGLMTAPALGGFLLERSVCGPHNRMEPVPPGDERHFGRLKSADRVHTRHARLSFVCLQAIRNHPRKS